MKIAIANCWTMSSLAQLQEGNGFLGCLALEERLLVSLDTHLLRRRLCETKQNAKASIIPLEITEEREKVDRRYHLKRAR